MKNGRKGLPMNSDGTHIIRNARNKHDPERKAKLQKELDEVKALIKAGRRRKMPKKEATELINKARTLKGQINALDSYIPDTSDEMDAILESFVID